MKRMFFAALLPLAFGTHAFGFTTDTPNGAIARLTTSGCTALATGAEFIAVTDSNSTLCHLGTIALVPDSDATFVTDCLNTVEGTINQGDTAECTEEEITARAADGNLTIQGHRFGYRLNNIIHYVDKYIKAKKRARLAAFCTAYFDHIVTQDYGCNITCSNLPTGSCQDDCTAWQGSYCSSGTVCDLTSVDCSTNCSVDVAADCTDDCMSIQTDELFCAQRK
jgi:hypothetical protein